jgi:hypothetical protein
MHHEHGKQISRRFVFTCAILASASCATSGGTQPAQQAQLAQALAPPVRLAPPDQLSETARSLLRTRMAAHARGMGELVSAIMLLHYPEIQDGAREIAADASLSRPLSADASELNSALPERFFLYQDQLRLEAKTLAEASERQSPYDVADSYGRLSQVCVRCHAVYRAGR